MTYLYYEWDAQKEPGYYVLCISAHPDLLLGYHDNRCAIGVRLAQEYPDDEA